MVLNGARVLSLARTLHLSPWSMFAILPEDKCVVEQLSAPTGHLSILRLTSADLPCRRASSLCGGRIIVGAPLFRV